MSGHPAGTFSTPTGPATNRKHHQVAAVSPWTLMANGRMKTARQPDHISARKQPVGMPSQVLRHPGQKIEFRFHKPRMSTVNVSQI